ncbi:MAG: amidohydrolase [Acidimicrobiales bacterium]|nr:MAG: amidohydrolase [Acidimicrobiales bacterium]
MLDVIIKGGTVVDGTGAAGVRADVGVRDGRIVAIGDVTEDATETIDATGMIVCPGFVDPHTHYDAQLFWDPHATPSNLFGVTSMVAGNCGFTLAPLGDESDGEYLKHMMTKVEGMALEALEIGVPWNWNSFGEYLDRVAESGTAINVAFMVGHCALRRMVMKDDSVGHEATPEQIAAMRQLLKESIEAGGFGFSTGRSFTHSDADGEPVPSRWAAWDEVLELCEETEKHEGTTLEWVADGCLSGFDDSEVELMTKMSVTANRPINWNVLTIDSARPDAYQNQIAACEKANAEGARVMALTMPILVGMNMSLRTFCALFQLPGWMDYFDMPVDERMEKFRDPEVVTWLENQAARPEAGVFSRLTGWDNYMVGDTFSEANEGLKGRTVGDIARERGKRAFHTMVEIALEDDLKTVWWPLPTDDDAESWRLRAQAWEHDAVMIGGSDAGAHLDRMAGAPYTTAWIQDCLHGRQLTSMENAVRHMTEVPARLFGFTERGRIAEGWHADIVVFDPETIGATDVELVFDLPGDSKRLWSTATGITRVLVNGVVAVADGEATGAIPGKVLRSGIDTETVTASTGV